MKIIYSLVVPLKNEAENIQDLLEEIEPVMTKLQQPWEVICVDDGSTDNTLSILTACKISRPYLRILSFSKNCGQTSAFDAGFKAARGEYVITLDGDRQNDPKDIPLLTEAIKDCDLVCGQRVKEKTHG